MTCPAHLKFSSFMLSAILLMAPALAQEQQKAEPPSSPEATAKSAPKAEAPPAKPNQTPATVLDLQEADGVVGKNVRSASGEDMGRIIDVIVAADGEVRAAVIDFGGFLGVGSRKVAVDWHALQFGKDGKTGNVTSALTRDQIRISPEIKAGEPIVVLGIFNEKSEQKGGKNTSGVNGKTPENIPAPAPQAPANPPAQKTEPAEAPQQKP